jgi:DNA gyrase subunit B
MPENLQNEEIIKQIRRRPGMYFGRVDERGVEQFVYELVSNAIDSHLANQASFVKVELDGATISVTDEAKALKKLNADGYTYLIVNSTTL